MRRLGDCLPFKGECPNRVELIELVVQGIAAIFRSEQGVDIAEGQVIERSVISISEKEDRDPAAIAVFVEINPKDRTPEATSSEVGIPSHIYVGVSNRTEEEDTVT